MRLTEEKDGDLRKSFKIFDRIIFGPSQKEVRDHTSLMQQQGEPEAAGLLLEDA